MTQITDAMIEAGRCAWLAKEDWPDENDMITDIIAAALRASSIPEPEAVTLREALTDARNNILSLLGGFRDDMPEVAVKLFQAQAKQIDAALTNVSSRVMK